MKSVAYLLGVALIVVGAVYLLRPAAQLPAFFPGFDAASMQVHVKHGIAAGVLGIILILGGWFMSRRSI